jgi:hypothetical protein
MLDTGAAVNLATLDPRSGYFASRVQGKPLVMTATAEQQFQSILARYAGSREAARTRAVLNRIHVVPDNPSTRVQNLIERAGVTADDKPIFGTADEMGIVIATTDRRFVLEAQRQGVSISHDLWVTPLRLMGI